MTDIRTTVAIAAILGTAALAAMRYGVRYRKRRRAEQLRRRGYKEYNRGRARLVVDQTASSSTTGTTGRS